MSIQVTNFEFQNVEDFFQDTNNNEYQGGYRDWAKLGKVIGYEQKDTNSLELLFKNNENDNCAVLLHFPSPNTFRFRFNPVARDSSFYPQSHSRCIVGDSEAHLSSFLEKARIELQEEGHLLNILVKNSVQNTLTMKLVVNRDAYNVNVYIPQEDGSFLKVHGDANTAIYYRKRLCYINSDEHQEEYSIIQAKEMSATAKYVGFGEKGGFNLIRNGARLTYFNFDNMRYRQIYNNGPLDIREPLYDSNPFFMELNRYPDKHSTYGIFLDNTSESFMDMGTYNSDREYLFGTMYGTLDYYFFMGRKSADVLKSYYTFVGTTKLKPRFILGNHQGCYGYENLYDLQDAVNGYRGNNIPLDGLHVDVDIQQNYSTFTIDEGKFPENTFDQLAQQGIKCSTNITPVISYTNLGYKTFESGNKNSCFVLDKKVGHNENIDSDGGYYKGGVYYGGNRGTFGHYPDLGRMEVRKWWGQQYRLLYERGLEMVWQDMTTPAIPNPNENWDVKLWAPKYNQEWKIGDKITSTKRSFPFELLVTDNSLKKYEGEAFNSVNRGLVDGKSPAVKIRNLYSYNLHKATFHGLNYLWYVNQYTFTTLGSEGITSNEAMTIANRLLDKNVLKVVNKKHKIFEVNRELNYDDPNFDLGVPQQYQHLRNEITTILKQSVEIERRRKNKRNFIIGRGGFTGMHRFAGLWNGDNASSWDFLKINISQVLALGIAGQSMSGQDIGGFEREEDWQQWVDPELFIRWISAGAFLPWFRNHYIKKGQKLFQEPYKFQDYINQVPVADHVFYHSVLPVSQYYVQLRYRLLQLFYDAMFENTLNGMPIARPMFMNDDHDHAFFNGKEAFVDDQFFVGNNLLIAPVLDKQSDGRNGWREIYLPVDNNWYNFKNNRKKLDSPVIGGGRPIAYDAHISDDLQHIPFILPIYVREGAIIPSIELEQFVGERNSKGELNPVTLNIYPGYKSEYHMYQDDGVSRSSAPSRPQEQGGDTEARGEYRKTIIRHYEMDDQLVVEFKWTHNNYKPLEDFCFIALLHDPSEEIDPLEEIKLESVNFNQGKNLSLQKITEDSDKDNSSFLWNSPHDAWYYNKDLHTSFIKMYFNEELGNVNSNQCSVSDDTPEEQASTVLIKTIKKGDH